MAELYPGIFKVIEECGELLQELGKRLVCPSSEHWDEKEKGPLDRRIEDEMGDVLAAIEYLAQHEPRLDKLRVHARRKEKFERFIAWKLSGINGREE